MVVWLWFACPRVVTVPPEPPGPTDTDTAVPTETALPPTGTTGATGQTGATAQTGDTGIGPTPLRVFATSTLHDGDLGGTAGADVICNDRAAAGGLDGVWRAWLSVGGIDVLDRLATAVVPYERTDGVRIADDFAGFASATHLVPIDRDEFGQPITTDVATWTATNPDGQASGEDCQRWTTNAATQDGIGGNASRSDPGWSAGNGGACPEARRLYCVEFPDEDVAKQVFVTSTTTSGDLGGLAGADQTCNELAIQASLAGYFRAWVSTVAGDAPSSRFRQFNGEYTLVGGVDPVIATDWADLTDGDLARPIEVSEAGTAVSGSFGDVWTGTNDFGDVFPAFNCSNWTIGQNAQEGRTGTSSSAGMWSSANTATCNLLKRLYCMQQ